MLDGRAFSLKVKLNRILGKVKRAIGSRLHTQNTHKQGGGDFLLRSLREHLTYLKALLTGERAQGDREQASSPHTPLYCYCGTKATVEILDEHSEPFAAMCDLCAKAYFPEKTWQALIAENPDENNDESGSQS